MLASDNSPREVKFVRGWIAVQRQRSRKVSMFELLTRGLGYGPRERKAQGKLNVYASTAEEPSDTDRAQPAHRPGGTRNRNSYAQAGTAHRTQEGTDRRADPCASKPILKRAFTDASRGRTGCY